MKGGTDGTPWAAFDLYVAPSRDLVCLEQKSEGKNRRFLR
jgi:hypothetical protein